MLEGPALKYFYMIGGKELFPFEKDACPRESWTARSKGMATWTAVTLFAVVGVHSIDAFAAPSIVRMQLRPSTGNTRCRQGVGAQCGLGSRGKRDGFARLATVRLNGAVDDVLTTEDKCDADETATLIDAPVAGIG